MLAQTPDHENNWPELPYSEWKDTCATLHLWTQIVGKIRLACTPWLNHSWHVTLYPTVRGLTTSLIPYKQRCFGLGLWPLVGLKTGRILALPPSILVRACVTCGAELGPD
jgi:Family of unknown function (DUF5996)